MSSGPAPSVDASVGRGAVDPEGVLDNAVWHALAGAQRPLGALRGHAARFAHEVSPFAALGDPGEGAWGDLAALVGPGGATALLMPAPPPPPDGWSVVVRMPCLQLVAPAVAGAPAAEAEELGRPDVGAMLDLVERTQPGPFRSRTIELGRYIGIKRDGRLVAMAGERVRPPGHVEISAVCTDPAHQGEGLATALMLDLVGAITARGAVPFLHVLEDNHRALGLYEHLGFRVRRPVEAVVLQAPDPDSPPDHD